MTVALTTQTIPINGLNATLNTWQSEGREGLTPIHFAHGNGFPSRCYTQMLAHLTAQTERTLYALDHRATWVDASNAPDASFSWMDAAKDMIAAIERVAPNGVIGVGHSLGGVMTLLAAHLRPDLFKQVILIEPVLFPTRMFLAAAWMPMAWRYRFFSIAKRTLMRKDVWSSRTEFVDYHASKPAFKGIGLDVMLDYAAHGLRPHLDQERFELTFPKAWEAHIFRSAPYPWRALHRLKVPCVGARAEKSHWIPSVSWIKWQGLRPDLPLHVLPQLGHMAPLQAPKAVADWVVSVIADK